MGVADAKTATESNRASPRKVFLLAALCFVTILIVRWPVMIAHQDTWYPFEVHAGTIALSLLDGVELDVAKLPIVPHARGCVLFGVLLAPFYAVFGASAVLMKSLPLVWHATTIALLVALFLRAGKRGAALAAAILFAFAPPMLAKLSTIGLSSHLESMLFFVGAIACVRALATSRSARSALGLGLVVGGAGFFHLQSLLPCLLMLALSLPALRAAGPRAMAATILGIALGGAPSFCFSGGNLALLGVSLGSAAAQDVADADAPGANPRPLPKLRDLVVHDFAYALEYGELGEVGAWIGGGFAAAIVILGLLGAWRERGAISSFLRALPRKASEAPPLALCFLLHAAGVIALYLFSHARHQEEIGAGLTNRHLAPVYFSCLAAAALGIGSLRKPLGIAVSFLLALPGIFALGSIATPSEAQRLTHRGECYEWYVAQLHPDSRANPEQAAALVERIDRGDERFRPLRFRLNLLPPSVGASENALTFGKRLKAIDELSQNVRNYAYVDLGRRAAPAILVFDESWAAAFAEIDTAERAWALRGIGLGIEPPRLNIRARGGTELAPRLRRLLRQAAPADADAILEGLGFQLGAVFEPYNVNLRSRMAKLDFLPADRAPALWRGIGWGAAQRYLVPPTAAPQGLVLFEFVPASSRNAFLDAFTGRTSP